MKTIVCITDHRHPLPVKNNSIITMEADSFSNAYSMAWQYLIDNLFGDYLGMFLEEAQGMDFDVPPFMSDDDDSEIDVDALYAFIGRDPDLTMKAVHWYFNKAKNTHVASIQIKQDADPMTSICIFEEIMESMQNSSSENIEGAYWKKFSDTHGAYELREQAITTAPYLDESFKLFGDDGFQDAFDWEFIPQMLRYAIRKAPDSFLDWNLVDWIDAIKHVFREKLLKLDLDSSSDSFNSPIDILETDIFKDYLEKTVNAVKHSAEKANVDPAGFQIDEAMCDFGEIETSDVVDVIDEAAALFGSHDSVNYKFFVEALCVAITERFSKH